MFNLNASPSTSADYQPLDHSAATLDAYVIDDEFDDAIDYEILAIRETLADFRQF